MQKLGKVYFTCVPFNISKTHWDAALIAAYQTDERSVSEVKKQPTDVYLFACFLACRLFIKPSLESLCHIFRPSGSFRSPPASKTCPLSPAHTFSFCLHFGQVSLLAVYVNSCKLSCLASTFINIPVFASQAVSTGSRLSSFLVQLLHVGRSVWTYCTLSTSL